MSGDGELKARPAQLRMQACTSHGGVDRRPLELSALAASRVGKRHHRIGSHYALLKQDGMTVDQLRDVGRIAAVVAAAANAMSVAPGLAAA
jgi:alkyl hydroperoxide reductase subunit D